MTDQTAENGFSWGRAVAIGLAVSVLTALIAQIMLRAGVSPLPKPPSLAFAETLAGRALPLPVGLLFHTAYVTFWSLVYLRVSPRHGGVPVLILAGLLWLGVLIVFFPVVGWGFAGTAISVKLIPASAIPHLLFALFLWAGERLLPPARG